MTDRLPLVPSLVLVASFLAGGIPVGIAAQDSLPEAERLLVRPNPGYQAGGFHRWLFGDGYRDLWSVEVPVEVLDLDRHAGGIAPAGPVEHLGLRALDFVARDGRLYRFYPVDLTAGLGLDSQLRGSIADDVLQDQVSSTLPFSDPVVEHLLAAVGLPHVQRDLVVLPDDPVLGEYRDEFGGSIGYIGPRLVPDRTVEGGAAVEEGEVPVLGTRGLSARLRDDPASRVDQRTLLRTRYLDMLLGDWNRNPELWRWVGRPEPGGSVVFEPLPAPRVWAFSRLDGVVQSVASLRFPQFVGFRREFPDVSDASWSARGIDRALLTSLDSVDFADVAADVARALDDGVIEEAVRRLPETHYQRVGPDLESALKHRRDRLPEFALRYHALLARWVDIDATDLPDVVEVQRHSDGRTTITIEPEGRVSLDGAPWYRRTFHPGRTDEIRIRTHEGFDRVTIGGDVGDDPIPVRILGGEGRNRIDDRTSGRGLWVHDPDEDDRVELGSEATLDRVEWYAPDDPAAEIHAARPRDWGTQWAFRPTIEAGPRDGLVLGAATTRFGYDFRRYPWSDRVEIGASIGTTTWKPNLSAAYVTRTFARFLRGEIRAEWRGGRADRFHGLGNAVSAPEGERRYRAWRSELSVTGALRADPSVPTGLSVGVRYRRSDPDANPGTVIDELAPYGYAEFHEVQLFGAAVMDRRDDAALPRGGYHLQLALAATPPLLDARDWYGQIGGTVAAYLDGASLPLRPTLATRVVARRVLGDAPWFALTGLGDGDGLRGFRNQRYLGDTSLAASVELRGELADYHLFFPGELGLLTLVDAGRVWLDGRSPGRWHVAVGAGLWTRLLEAYTASLTVTRGERWAVNASLGLPF